MPPQEWTFPHKPSQRVLTTSSALAFTSFQERPLEDLHSSQGCLPKKAGLVSFQTLVLLSVSKYPPCRMSLCSQSWSLTSKGWLETLRPPKDELPQGPPSGLM